MKNSDKAGRTPLFYAAMGETADVRELLLQGADANARDKNLETPLHFAAREYQLSAAQMLIEAGAMIDAQDGNGNTPLSHAVFESRGRGEMIVLLLSAGADRTIKNNCGVSPEDLANTIANYDIAQFLR